VTNITCIVMRVGRWFTSIIRRVLLLPNPLVTRLEELEELEAVAIAASREGFNTLPSSDLTWRSGRIRHIETDTVATHATVQVGPEPPPENPLLLYVRLIGDVPASMQSYRQVVLYRENNSLFPTEDRVTWHYDPTTEDIDNNTTHTIEGFEVLTWKTEEVIWHQEFPQPQVAAANITMGTFNDNLNLAWNSRSFFEGRAVGGLSFIDSGITSIADELEQVIKRGYIEEPTPILVRDWGQEHDEG
jgi:hypothetical protein